MSKTQFERNILYNFVGSVAPLLATILTVPQYLRAIGEVRFGVLSLVWLIFGYFGLFDFGLSRAAANQLSQLRTENKSERVGVFYTALFMNGFFGIVAAAAFYASASVLLVHLTGRASELNIEILQALPWIAGFFPLALMGGVFVGAMEAEERFFELNVQQIVGSVFLQVFPLIAVLLFEATIEVAVIGAIVARIIAIAWLAFTVILPLSRLGRPTINIQYAAALLKYGAWVTATNGLSPLLVSLDQFVIASVLGARSVAYYSVSYSIATKVLLLPGAFSRTLFPQLSNLTEIDAKALASRAVFTLSGILSTACASSILLVEFGLQIWIGSDFAREATSTARLILVGTYFNGLAFVPFALLQAQRKPERCRENSCN